MTLAIPLDEDHHVHSTYSDGRSTLAENVAAARARGLRRLCLTDHVRAGTEWLPGYVSEVAALQSDGPALLTGVEAKVLDADGHLDVPADLAGVEVMLVADHQFPAKHGPVLPDDMRVLIERGVIGAAEAARALADATAAALARVTGQRPVLAHLFSILPKMGIDESCVPDAALDRLIGRTAATGAALEINEKWACPSAVTVQAFASAGVPVLAGSDSHESASIGIFPAVTRTIMAVAAGSA